MSCRRHERNFSAAYPAGNFDAIPVPRRSLSQPPIRRGTRRSILTSFGSLSAAYPAGNTGLYSRDCRQYLSAPYPAGNKPTRFPTANHLSRLSGGERTRRTEAWRGQLSQPPIRRGNTTRRLRPLYAESLSRLSGGEPMRRVERPAIKSLSRLSGGNRLSLLNPQAISLSRLSGGEQDRQSAIVALYLSAAYPAGNDGSGRKLAWTVSQPPIRRGTHAKTKMLPWMSQPPIRRGNSEIAVNLSVDISQPPIRRGTKSKQFTPITGNLSAAYPAGNSATGYARALIHSLSRLSGGELRWPYRARLISLSRLSGGELLNRGQSRRLLLSAAYPAGNMPTTDAPACIPQPPIRRGTRAS